MQREMQRRTLSLLAALAAALPFASHAGTMDYSYAELGYVDTDVDEPVDVDGDGFALRGSLDVNENFFVFAGYQDLGFDFGVDSTALQIGAGGHWPLRNQLDIVGRVGIIKADWDGLGGGDDDDNGFSLGARVRTVLAPQFEVEGGIEHVDFDDLGNETSLVLEGRYFFIEQVAGGLLVQVGDDATTLGVNVRWTF